MYVRMTFGRHKGELLENVPASYLRWVVANCANAKPWLLWEIQAELDRRGYQQQRQPPPPPPRPQGGGMIDLASLITSWYRTMSRKNHADCGGCHEAMTAVNEGVELLRKLAGVK
jgi:uncharacterized protein (DUF3820 family)